MMRKIIILTLIFITIIFVSCIYDPVIKNITVENNSKNGLIFTLINEPKFIDSLFYEAYNKDKSYYQNKDFFIEPGQKGFIITNRHWENLVEKDTSLLYLYVVDIYLMDSLKKEFKDINEIRKKSEKIYILTYKKLKDMNWTISYP